MESEHINMTANMLTALHSMLYVCCAYGVAFLVSPSVARSFLLSIPRTPFENPPPQKRRAKTVQILPPSLVVVAWTTFGTVKNARDFLGDGVCGIRSIKPGLPVAVVGGKSDGEVR